MCDERTEHPPGRTVRVDRRSRGCGARRSRPSTPAQRQRTDHPGGGPGVAGISLRTSLDPPSPQQPPVAWHVPLPARPVGLPQAVENAQPLPCKTILILASCCPSWFDDLWMTDATPLPCGMSRQTVKRSELAGHAGYGYCASHRNLAQPDHRRHHQTLTDRLRPLTPTSRNHSSRRWSSVSPSLTSSAASASPRWPTLVAPTMGAATPGLCISHAKAICAGGRSRSAANAVTASTTSKSESS